MAVKRIYGTRCQTFLDGPKGSHDKRVQMTPLRRSTDVDEEPKIKVKQKVDVFFFWPIIVFFFLLWAQSGWYRIDCALGVKRACDLIGAEYAKKDKP